MIKAVATFFDRVDWKNRFIVLYGNDLESIRKYIDEKVIIPEYRESPYKKIKEDTLEIQIIEESDVLIVEEDYY